MKLLNLLDLNHARDLVFFTYRDQLVDLLPQLPDIESIQVLSREQVSPKVVRIENLWRARANIPRVARGVVKPEWLEWIDRAEWNEQDWSCTWSFELPALREIVQVAGINHYLEPAAGRTCMRLAGELTIDLSKMPGVPRFLSSSLQPQVERFLRAMIVPNLQSVTRGLDAHLLAQARASAAAQAEPSVQADRPSE